MEVLTPTMHKPVPMGARVAYQLGSETRVTGRVAGVAVCNVIFIYIVILDEPLTSGFGVVEAISVPGTLLEGLDGTNWRLEA